MPPKLSHLRNLRLKRFALTHSEKTALHKLTVASTSGDLAELAAIWRLFPLFDFYALPEFGEIGR